MSITTYIVNPMRLVRSEVRVVQIASVARSLALVLSLAFELSFLNF